MSKISKLAIAGLLTLSAGQAFATDGTINFTGTIFDTTCNFEGGDTVNVELGTYAADQFKSAGDRSPKIPFTIPLENCPTTPWDHDDGRKDASFRLWLETRNGSTVEDTVNNHTLVSVASMKPGAATGVGIQIETDDGTPMKINELTDVIFPITGEKMNVNLKAYYVSTVDPDLITPGEANATVDVTLDYR